jgi:hypothetical protein
MTPELQRAMARYEEAYLEYRKALLASHGHSCDGSAVRQAIRAFQDARAELRRLEATLSGAEPSTAGPTAATSRPQGRGLFVNFLKAS